MARHLEAAAAAGMRMWFWDAANSWQCVTNKSPNGLLRQYFPKSTALPLHTPADLARVELELNQRPRMALGDRRPAELLNALLPAERPTVAMTWRPPRRHRPSIRPSSTPCGRLTTGNQVQGSGPKFRWVGRRPLPAPFREDEPPALGVRRRSGLVGTRQPPSGPQYGPGRFASAEQDG